MNGNLEDPVLDRHLAALEHFTPGSTFEDRVMAQVRLPPPAWARRLSGWQRALVRTRPGRTVLGGLAAASVASVTFAGFWAQAHADRIGMATGWLATQIWLPVWQQSVRFTVSILSSSVYTIASLVAPKGVALLGVASGLTLLASGFGLHRLMTQARGVRKLPA